MSVNQKKRRGISVTLLNCRKENSQNNYQLSKNTQELNVYSSNHYVQCNAPPLSIINANTSSTVYKNQSQILDNHIRQLQIEIVKARTRLSQINYVNTQSKVSQIRSNQCKFNNFSFNQIKGIKDQSKSLLIASKVNKVKQFTTVKQEEIIQGLTKKSVNKSKQKSIKKTEQFKQNQQQTIKKQIKNVMDKNRQQQKKKSFSDLRTNEKDQASKQKYKLKTNKNKAALSQTKLNKKLKPNLEFNFFNNQILTKALNSNQKKQGKVLGLRQKKKYKKHIRPNSCKKP